MREAVALDNDTLTTRTLQESQHGEQDTLEDEGVARPGLVLVSCHGRPACVVLALGASSGAMTIGRDSLERGGLSDPSLSRQHAEVRYDAQRFWVRDLGSRNGTFVDGKPASEVMDGAERRVIRAGHSIFLACPDVRPFETLGVERMAALVLGPTMAATWRVIGRLARTGSSMCLHGESGVGKERAVQVFHAQGPRSDRPLVAVNCSAIPEGMAERLLFGTKRGAYSGATADAEGYVQAADGGVLFLDEVAELDLAVQAKLLRVLESKEVMPLGENRPRRVDFQLCAASHKDLREEIARGRFRQDLYFRLGLPTVGLPPLRARVEEIPWLIDMVVQQTAGEALAVHSSFVEACLLRRWPGNVRELITETRAAVHQALAHGSSSLRDAWLPSGAGVGFAAAGSEARVGTGSQRRDAPARAIIEAALRAHHGNVAATARAMHVHRTQLRRWLARYGIEVGKADEAAPGDVDEGARIAAS
jgi:transcriptional regulator of acetoin/glycerol metabolism